MHKLLAFFGVLLLIVEIFPDSNSVRAVVLPYFRHQRYPFREEELRRPLIIVRAVPVVDMDRYLTGTMLMTQKRSQPDNDFDYINDFDPTKIFL